MYNVTMDRTSAEQALAAFSLQLRSQEYHSLQKLADLLLMENQKYNLTGLRTLSEVWEKHFVDSLSCCQALDFNNKKAVDVGSGAGFPVLPLAIFFPQSQFTALEARGKKATFIAKAAQILGLENLQVFQGRAETAAHLPELRESFDIVLSRAVGSTAVLAELCLPLCKTNGFWLSLKDQSAEEEIRQGEKAVSIMGAQIAKKVTVYTGGRARILLVYSKIYPTPASYPRPDGIPARKPLI